MVVGLLDDVGDDVVFVVGVFFELVVAFGFV